MHRNGSRAAGIVHGVARRQVCVFDGQEFRAQGEHVWPRWFLRRYDGRGRFVIEINGVAQPMSSGRVERENLSRVLLPVCPDCNNTWLNRTFEVPAKPHVRAALDQLRPLAGPAVAAVARWVVKGVLLSRHPQAVDSELRDRAPGAWNIPDGLLPQMRATGDLPADLSLWVAVVNPDVPGAAAPDSDPILLPHTVRVDGAGGEGAAALVGFGLPTLGPQARVAFQLVYHPLMVLAHPFEAAGLATKLWPDPPNTLDLAAMPTLDAAGEAHLARVFAVRGPLVGLLPGERWPTAMISARLG